MKGYKALDKDMRAVHGSEMQYELGKTYTVDGDVVLCANGFHFCERIEDLNRYYDISKSRIFEVEAEGNIKSNNTEYAAQQIRLIRELTAQEINNYFKTNWESLVKSNNCDIRQAVAKQGYGLDELVYDKDWIIRCTVAEQGHGLDVLVNDEDYGVRRAVAEQGYGLDVLISDVDWRVRKAVAEQGYGLDILVHDEDHCVRKTVAKQGYGLDLLVNDKDWFVRETAKEMAERNDA